MKSVDKESTLARALRFCVFKKSHFTFVPLVGCDAEAEMRGSVCSKNSQVGVSLRFIFSFFARILFVGSNFRALCVQPLCFAVRFRNSGNPRCRKDGTSINKCSNCSFFNIHSSS